MPSRNRASCRRRARRSSRAGVVPQRPASLDHRGVRVLAEVVEREHGDAGALELLRRRAHIAGAHQPAVGDEHRPAKSEIARQRSETRERRGQTPPGCGVGSRMVSQGFGFWFFGSGCFGCDWSFRSLTASPEPRAPNPKPNLKPKPKT